MISYHKYQTDEITIGAIGGGTRVGGNAFWLRGGLLYRVFANQVPTLRTTDYTYTDQIYTVGTNFHGGNNAYVSIVWEATTT